ncbi:hypothetical protein N0V82_006172 [Gnomoniopsis sp. IMI 355080]|nr:hypothetical protein N0V82_006172 [Gnomoniopsis sp. IMI 355080]
MYHERIDAQARHGHAAIELVGLYMQHNAQRRAKVLEQQLKARILVAHSSRKLRIEQYVAAVLVRVLVLARLQVVLQARLLAPRFRRAERRLPGVACDADGRRDERDEVKSRGAAGVVSRFSSGFFTQACSLGLVIGTAGLALFQEPGLNLSLLEEQLNPRQVIGLEGEAKAAVTVLVAGGASASGHAAANIAC